MLCWEDWFGDKDEFMGTVLGIWWCEDTGLRTCMLGLLGWDIGLNVDLTGGLRVRRFGLTEGPPLERLDSS